MAALLLTDDEVLAVSARLDAPWRTWIPTVEVGIEQAVLAAVARGSRSLYVRGLLDADSDLVSHSVVGLLQAIGDRPVALAALACDEAGDVIEGTPSQYFFGSAGDPTWVCDSISAGGVHTIDWSSSADAIADAAAAVDAVHRNGTGVEGAPEARFVMFAQHEREVRRLAVSQGALALARVSGDDVAAVGPERAASSADALRWVLGR